MFTDEKPNISHLQIFRYLVYIHIPKEKRINVEHCGKKVNFVSYSDTSKEFIIYVPIEGHVEVSQDVTFHEEASFKWLEEIECDIETYEAKAPISKGNEDDYYPYDVQRENPAEHVELRVIDELVELVNEPPTKGR